MYIGHSSYLRRVFSPRLLGDVVEKTHLKLQEMKEKGYTFDAIAFTGNSGAGIAFPLSAKYGYNLICVRKGEYSHGKNIEASPERIEKYVIVDDQIDRGDTVRRVLNELEKADLQCQGIVLYTLEWSAGYFKNREEEIPTFYVFSKET